MDDLRIGGIEDVRNQKNVLQIIGTSICDESLVGKRLVVRVGGNITVVQFLRRKHAHNVAGGKFVRKSNNDLGASLLAFGIRQTSSVPRNLDKHAMYFRTCAGKQTHRQPRRSRQDRRIFIEGL